LLKTAGTDQTRIGFGGDSYAHYKGVAAHSKAYRRHRQHVYSCYETTESFISNYKKRFEQNRAARTHVNFDYSSRKAVSQSRIGFPDGVGTGRIRNFDKVAADPAAAPPVCE